MVNLLKIFLFEPHICNNWDLYVENSSDDPDGTLLTTKQTKHLLMITKQTEHLLISSQMEHLLMITKQTERLLISSQMEHLLMITKQTEHNFMLITKFVDH